LKTTLSFLIVPLLIFLSHYTSIITYSVVRQLKLGSYVTPLFGWKFDHWFSYIVCSMGVFQVLYWINGIMLFTAYKLSFDHFGTMYPAVILNLIAVILWTIWMMYLRVGEVPTRDGWFALILIILASLLAMNAGKNVKP